MQSWLELGVTACWRRLYVDLFDHSELDEVIGSALLELVKSLARFRGEDERSLRAFVARIGRRTMNKHAHRRLRERQALREEKARLQDEISALSSSVAFSNFDVVQELPLSQEDRRFLKGLLDARTQCELALALGLSNGRVTQIKTKVFERVRSLDAEGRGVVTDWLLAGAPL